MLARATADAVLAESEVGLSAMLALIEASKAAGGTETLKTDLL
jgi:hypothetical protein